jgi:hypothetical protein
LSSPHEYHQTEAFKELIVRIKEYFEAQKIPVYEKPASALHCLYPSEQKKTKKALMQALTIQYPQLTLCYHKELRNKNKYYIKVFEAVAVAALHEQEN